MVEMVGQEERVKIENHQSINKKFNNVFKLPRHVKTRLLNLNVENGASPMIDGLNIFILPQSVYLNSEAFYDINLSDDPEDIDEFMPDDSVWSCPGTDESAYNIISTISLNHTNTEAQELLSKLTHNDTGTKITWYEDITDCVYTVGLPHTVVSMIGVEAMENLTWGTSSSSSFFGRVIKWVEDAGDAAWNLISETVLLDDLIDAVSDWGFDVVNDIAEDLEDIKDMVLDGKDFLIAWLKQQVENIVDPVLNEVKSQIGMEFLEGLGISGLSIALSLADSGSSKKDIMTQAASPGFDAITTFFSPLITVVGTASALIDNYASFIKEPVEKFLNDLVVDGVIDIVNLIMPLDEDTENMIRNATGGDVDPEIENAAENMSNELNFTSKDAFIGSVYDSYKNGTEEENGNEVYVLPEFYAKPQPKKIALLIGQGGAGVDNGIHNDMTKLYRLLRDNGYSFIRGNNSSYETSSYYNWDFITKYYTNFVPTKNGIPSFLDDTYDFSYEATIDYLMKMLGDNLTTGNEQVFVCIAGHGGFEESEKDMYTTNDVTYDGEAEYKSIKWDFIGEKLDYYTLSGTNQPKYASMTIVVHTCYSGYVLDPFYKNDKKQRIVITATDDSELAYGTSIDWNGWGAHCGFLTHFINFLDGDGWAESWQIFQTKFIAWILIGMVAYAIAVLLFSVATGGLGYLLILAAMLAIAITYSFFVYIDVKYFSSENIYDAYEFAEKHTINGCGFGGIGLRQFFLGSTPQIRNKELAKRINI